MYFEQPTNIKILVTVLTIKLVILSILFLECTF